MAKDLCPRFEAAVDLLARRWTPLIVQQLEEGARRFSEIGAAIPALSERMLSERLKDLEEGGVLTRRVLPEPPVRVEYALTDKGRALAKVVAGLASWAEKWVQPLARIEPRTPVTPAVRRARRRS